MLIQLDSMWKLLYQLASPKLFYHLTGRFISGLAIATTLTFAIGLCWALVYAPADYQQGDAFRILYIHVPSAFFSMAIYGWMGFLAVLLLVWRIKLAGLLLMVAAQLGACMALLALITGSIWGRPMWGTWWIWDARLTSELILLFLYTAILATGHAYTNKDQGDKVLAVLTLVGLLDLPIIHYSVYWWNTLHQGATLSVFSKPKIHSSMLYPLLVMLLGFGLYSVLTIILGARHVLLQRERRQRWVQEIMQ